jgi:hypothetical protein
VPLFKYFLNEMSEKYKSVSPSAAPINNKNQLKVKCTEKKPDVLYKPEKVNTMLICAMVKTTICTNCDEANKNYRLC